MTALRGYEARAARLDMSSRLLVRDFMRMMEAKRTAAVTRQTYGHALCSLAEHAGALDSLASRDAQDWLVALAASRSAGTVATYYRHARRFYRWAVAAGAVDRSPMDGAEAPREPVKIVPVVTDDTLAALLATCKGKTYRDRRDAAAIRLLAYCGLRASELCGLTLDDLDMASDVLLVRQGKWSRDRLVSFSAPTGLALSAFLRARPRAAGTGAAFAGVRAPHAPLTRSGLAQMLAARCRQAGVPVIHPHQLRHTCVAKFFHADGTERDAMELFGWLRSEMCKKYGKAAAARTAVEHFRKMDLGEVA